MAWVYIPGPMRRLTGGQDRVQAGGQTVGGVLQDLARTHPGIGERLFEADGQLKRFVNVFLNGDEIRGLSGAATPVSEEDEVAIIPAMAGGRGRGGALTPNLRGGQ